MTKPLQPWDVHAGAVFALAEYREDREGWWCEISADDGAADDVLGMKLGPCPTSWEAHQMVVDEVRELAGRLGPAVTMHVLNGSMAPWLREMEGWQVSGRGLR